MSTTIETLAALTEAEYDGASFNGAPLRKTLSGLTLEQATTTDTFEGYSVCGIVLHLLYWKHTLSKLLGGTGAFPEFPYEEKDWPAVPDDVTEAWWASLLSNLDQAHRDYTATLRGLAEARLDDQIEEWKCSRRQACAWMSSHDTYHLAQIRNMGVSDLATR